LYKTGSDFTDLPTLPVGPEISLFIWEKLWSGKIYQNLIYFFFLGGGGRGKCILYVRYGPPDSFNSNERFVEQKGN